MGCDIHLYVEIRQKSYNPDWKIPEGVKPDWTPISYRGEFNDRVYGMFAALANVRNYHNLQHLPVRGIPDDISYKTFDEFFKHVKPKNVDRETLEWEYDREDVKYWYKNKYSFLFKKNGILYCSNPDYHTPSWCTSEELQNCFHTVFGEKQPYEGDYIEWFALISYMKAFESTGEYDCRAVFWFDN